MGSSQSTEENTSPIKETSESSSINVTNEKETKKSKPKLTGYALVERKCRKKKRMYDICYQKKHSAFIMGKKVEDDEEEDCDDLFEAYKDCIFLGMLKDREKRNKPPPRPESALADFKEQLEDEDD